MKYFSTCILEGTDPEPDGLEGLADVGVIEAALLVANSETPERQKDEVGAALDDLLRGLE